MNLSDSDGIDRLLEKDKKVKEYKSFKLDTVETPDGISYKQVIITNESLVEFLRNFIRTDSIYDDQPNLLVEELFTYSEAIKNYARRNKSNAAIKELLAFIELENKAMSSRVANMTASGNISFGLLQHLFPVGSEIIIDDSDSASRYGGKVVSSEYITGFMGIRFRLTYDYVSSNGRKFVSRRANLELGAWADVKEIKLLPVQLITEVNKAALTERGRKFARVGVGSHYMMYSGHMSVKKWFYWEQLRSDGRIMVDTSTYGQFVSEYNDRDHEDSDMDTIPEDRLWMSDPWLKGFSFSTKQWGRFSLDQISDIQWRDHAFDQLVLDSDKKELVRALVTYGTGGFEDVISGKGGGCIFLLHGQPGTGKTLTAEAIAELLHRPLYSVSVGELGITPSELEEKLRQILDVAQIWKAVILIDEADIFLEKRTSGDILRNSMVGIMLKLLEYHQGVLFLTTNRVSDFDPAFYSRISIALKYDDLDIVAREQIWANLLDAAGITGLNPAELAKIDINGRQIKNNIRLAQGLAKQNGETVNMLHINRTMGISTQFLKDVGTANTF